MIAFFAVALLFSATLAGTVVVDYDGGPTWGDAWITLRMRGDPAQLLTLQTVTWCKSLIPNNMEAPELPLDCSGRNLMHMLLYPGKDQTAVLKEPPPTDSGSMAGDGTDAPSVNTFYVNPARVGGWDTLHQWYIIVEMSQRDGTTFRQVTRFNPLVPTTTTTVPVTTSTVETTLSKQNGETSTAETSTGAPATPEPAVAEHSWRAALVVLLVGVAVVGGVGGTVLYVQRAAQSGGFALNRERAQAVSRAYGGAYDFGGGGVHREEIEMTDLSSEEQRLHKEDMEILENMK